LFNQHYLIVISTVFHGLSASTLRLTDYKLVCVSMLVSWDGTSKRILMSLSEMMPSLMIESYKTKLNTKLEHSPQLF